MRRSHWCCPGFGAAISRRLGEAGATVFVADRNVEGAEQSAERLRGLGCDAIAHSAESVGAEELVIYWVLGGAGSLEDAGYVPASALPAK